MDTRPNQMRHKHSRYRVALRNDKRHSPEATPRSYGHKPKREQCDLYTDSGQKAIQGNRLLSLLIPVARRSQREVLSKALEMRRQRHYRYLAIGVPTQSLLPLRNTAKLNVLAKPN